MKFWGLKVEDMTPEEYDHYMQHALQLELLRELEETVPMTLSEREKVRDWVYYGNDIETNPWGYTDAAGYPLSYLAALRYETEGYAWVTYYNYLNTEE